MEQEDDNRLTSKQELFCQFYAQLSDTYGNGTWSYALAYGHDLENQPKDDYEKDEKNHNIPYSTSYDKMANMCAVGATRLLRNDKIIERVRDLKATWVDDDKIIDSRMLDIIIQGKDTDSIAAIKHRNELKQRVTKKLALEFGDPATAALKKLGLIEDDGEAESPTGETS